VHAVGIYLQACSFNHSDSSPSLESTTCERLRFDYRTRRRAAKSFGIESTAIAPVTEGLRGKPPSYTRS
jgi:hypothetical protein